MANTITDFLVGVGFSYDQKGANEIGSGIDGIKSKALQLGGVVAGAFGLKKLTSDFAQSRDELGKFSQVFGVLPDDVFAFGQALEHEGGTLEGFMSQLAGIERMRAGLRVGDAGFIAMAGRAGIDTQPIEDATNAVEAYLALADQMQSMDVQGRLNAADALGLDEASIRLLSQGSDALRENVADMKQIRTVTKEMTEASAQFNDNMQDLTNNIGGFADRVSMTLLPGINDTVSGMNKWIGANRELINQNMDAVLKPIGDNFNTIATAGGLLATGGLLGSLAGMAKFVPLIGSGLATAASAAARLSVIGAGVTVGAELWDWDADKFEEVTGIKPPEWLFKDLNSLLGTGQAGGAGEPVPQIDRGFKASDLPTVDDVSAPDLPIFNNNVMQNGTGSKTLGSLDLSFNMDGNVFDRRTVQIIENQGKLAFEEIQQSVVS